MATWRLPILGHATNPDPGDTGYFQPYTILASNDVWAPLVFIFPDDSTRILLHGVFAVPQNYASAANIVIVWTAIAVAGDVEWDFDYRAVGGDDTESLDQAGTQESVNSEDTAPGAVNRRLELTIALTDGNFSAGDTVEYAIVRDGTDVGDTMAADAQLFESFFEYSD
jgi:hypothetical protein